MLDWSKLKPYQNDKYRSFEELCCQIAKGLYGHIGHFTRIDDSGGGDGVEFYMTLPNEDEEWGWQAKFYHPDERLNVSNRKAAIQKSLKRSCQNHQQLKKWILCTPTNFTPDEQSWFDDTLPKSVPQGMDVKLEHWGDSDLNTWLSEPRFSGKRNYFFGELELTLDWFRTQVDKQIAAIGNKFNPVLHTETSIDSRIHALLGDAAFTHNIAEQVAEFGELLEKYRKAVAGLSSPMPHQIDWGNAKSELLGIAQSLQSALTDVITQLKQAQGLLTEQRLDEVRRLDWNSVWTLLEQAYGEYKKAESQFDISKVAYTGKDEDRDRVLREAEEIVHRPAWAAARLMDALGNVLAQLDSIKQSDLHILGRAGTGKTHIGCNICHERLKVGIPALLVRGICFTSERPLEEQLRSILDIPPTYSWNDFLQALAAAAEAYHTRIPLVIDGLNEATYNGAFSKVWQVGLPGLLQEIAQTKNVVLITTCRETYQGAIWTDGTTPNMVNVYGFDADDVETAIEKYFNWYKITADLTATPLSQFEHPIYLKIFCEAKNPARQEEIHIYIGEQTLFEVFGEYLARCNRIICDRIGLHPNTPVVMPALNTMAECLWQHRSRGIPLSEMVMIVDDQPLDRLQWQSSKTKAIEDEGLLVFRDWFGDGEEVYFTYDLLGGYLIARHLIQQASDIKALLQSEEVKTALFSDDLQTLHPLYSDIRRSLAALLPVQTGQYLHDLLDNPIAFSSSIEALFEIPPEAVSQECVDLLARLFRLPQNREHLLEWAVSTVGHIRHPLNASFWSRQLKALPMPERDIGWTEYVRENYERIDKMLTRFEAACRSHEQLSEEMETRLYLLAEYTMWILTSTVRPLRDRATWALYWYGRRQPKQFFDLVISSLEINDPYVPERMLAATYGIAMARQYDFKDPTFAQTVLTIYGRKLYEAMFVPNAPHATTHILARDYARRTINIALIHHSNLLTPEERQRIIPPFVDGGIREWGESEDRNEDEYREGNYPFADFSSSDDPMGWLGPQIDIYHSNTPEYQRAKANLWWRIYELGYSLEHFGEVDKWIVHFNWAGPRSADGRWIDSYGRKYCLIAVHELAGYRDDLGLLRDE